MKVIAIFLVLIGALALAQTDKPPLEAKDIKLLPFVPTYYKDVKPIIDQNCVTCHTNDGIAPFSLEKPENATENARAIQLATMSRRMPHWDAVGESPEMQNDPRLSKEEIEIIANWAWSGAPLGKKEDYKPIEKPVQDEKPGLTVDIGAQYQPNKDLTDDYRCFLIDPKLQKEQVVTGYDFVPGNKSIVHHVILFQISSDLINQAKSIDKNDGKAGWTCFGGPGLSTNNQIRKQNDPAFSFVGSWVPGSGKVNFPKNTGVLLKPGSMLVMQVHYNLLGGNGSDKTAAKLYFSPKAEGISQIRSTMVVGEVEIPCPGAYPSDKNDKCSRDFAYKQPNNLDKNLMKALESGILSTFCKSDLKMLTQGGPANDITTKCDWPVEKDMVLLGIQPHMHLLGKAMKVDLNPQNANGHKVLIDVPSYDFHWQMSYWYKDPIILKKGDILRITCHFDNSFENQPTISGQASEPSYVIWGEGSTDEMCLAGLFTTVR